MYSAVNTGFIHPDGVQLQIAANNHISIHINSSYSVFISIHQYSSVASYSRQ